MSSDSDYGALNERTNNLNAQIQDVRQLFKDTELRLIKTLENAVDEIKSDNQKMFDTIKHKADKSEILYLKELIQEQKETIVDLKKDVEENSKGRIVWDTKTKVYAGAIIAIGAMIMNVLYQVSGEIIDAIFN